MSISRNLLLSLCALLLVCARAEAQDARDDRPAGLSTRSLADAAPDVSQASCVAPDDVPTVAPIYPGRNACNIAGNHGRVITAALRPEININKDEKQSLPTVSPPHGSDFNQTGLASWYGARFHHRRAANGEQFDMNKLSAAHPNLPLDSYVRVTNLENDRSVVVRVTDRGPFVAGRIIDLSAEAARQLGFKEKGLARVRLQVVKDQLGAL